MRFGLILGWLALLKKKFGAEYELLRTGFFMFPWAKKMFEIF